MKCFKYPTPCPVVTLLNARSLLSKIDELRLISDIKAPSIICVTETWLNESILSSLIILPKYQVYRSDRCFRRGGGVAVYIRDNSYISNITDEFAAPREVDCLLLAVHFFHVALVCIYIPPSAHSELLLEVHDFLIDFADKFLTMNPFYRLIIAGDMNQFNTNNLCIDLGLVDIVTNPTRLDNILDHILMTKDLASNYDRERVTYDAPIASSDHLMITCIPHCDNIPASITRWHKIYDFRRSHILRLQQQVSLIDWNSLLPRDSDVSELCDYFHDYLTNLLNLCIPSRMIPLTERDKDWMSPMTKMLIIDH